MTDLAELAAALTWPDHEAEQAAHDNPGDLGSLDLLSQWLAGAQSSFPAAELRRPRLVVFAGDHGVAELDVSALAVGATAARFAELAQGRSALAAHAEAAGVGVRSVDVSIDDDVYSPDRIRRGSGHIAHEDAMTSDETARAVSLGARIADDEIDAGADLLIAGALGRGASTAASALISIVTAAEPIKTVGRGSGIGDDAWMRKASAVRDARRRAWPARNDPVAVLTTAGSPELAALAGFLLAAAVRRTPVLLDGVVVSSAALVAAAAAPRVTHWWRAAQLGAEPGQSLALVKMGLTPVLDFGSPLGDGTGGLLVVPLLRAAVLRQRAASTHV